MERVSEAPHASWLLSFSRQLRQVDDYTGLVELVRAELHTHLGLTNAWLYVFEREDDPHAVLVAAAGTKAGDIRVELPIAPIAGDWLIAALRQDTGPIVIPDATQVEGNPDVARRLGNRTVVNMPIGVLDKALGILGAGTFGTEGAIPISAADVSYFVQLSNIAAVAVARLVLRSRDLARAQLQAQLAQRQRLESLGLLAGGVAHDFNNLLTVIRACVSFVTTGPLTEEQRNDMALISDAELSASELTRKLLMLGRQHPLSFEAADANEFVRAFLRLMQRVIPENIQVDFAAAEHLPHVRIDAHQMQQVLMNLALNARDAMPTGGRLTFETQPLSVDGEYRRAHAWASAERYVQLRVTDTGTGMPATVVERVFEPFFTTKPSGSGTGLGLAVAWNIVQQHAGVLHCDSKEGAGTSFTLYLPALDAAVSKAETKLTRPAPRGAERILVAEDKPQVQMILMRVLSDAGYIVTACNDGAQAVTAATSDVFDLHLLDAVMPVMGGREACERIRKLQPEARFLFLSGYGGDELLASFLDRHQIELITKPFNPDTLLRAVRATLDRSR